MSETQTDYVNNNWKVHPNKTYERTKQRSNEHCANARGDC